MEACPGAHYWGREIGTLGHTVRLIAPAYVKPFVKRQKNDAADAEAICEAAQRPTMRFVAVKSQEKQASAVIFRTRDVLVGQRTQLINAIRGHMSEFGLIAPQGPRMSSGSSRRLRILPRACRRPLAVALPCSSKRYAACRIRLGRWTRRLRSGPKLTKRPIG